MKNRARDWKRREVGKENTLFLMEGGKLGKGLGAHLCGWGVRK